MVEKNPTNAELIKVIECCSSGTGCGVCIARNTPLCDEWVDKVANLIRHQQEERTCENVSEMHPTDGFTCSECGITIVDYVEERVDEECTATYHEYEIKYCPNCGAKVVEE